MPMYSSLFTTVCCLFLLFGAVDGEDFTIYRGDVRRGADRFLVPRSLCNNLIQSGSKDVCGHYFGTINTNIAPPRLCDCFCPKNRSTFIFHNNEWTCLPNDILRCRQGCKYFFKDDTQKDPLKILTDGNKVSLDLSTTQRCGLHLNTSRYELCGKVWKPVIKDRKTPKRFSLVAVGISYQLQITRDTNANYLNAQIIKLTIKCTEKRLKPTESCLILKLRGPGIRCSATTPTEMTSLLPTMVCPSPTSSLSLSPTPSLSWSKVHSTKFSATVAKPSQEMSSSIFVVIPDGKGKRGNKSRGSATTAVIIGPIVAVLVLVIIVSVAFAFVYYRRKKSRNRDRHKSTRAQDAQETMTMSPQANLAFQPDVQTGYASIGFRQPTYASCYNVPEQPAGTNTSYEKKNGSLEETPPSDHLYANVNDPEPVNNSLEEPEEPYSDMSHNIGDYENDLPRHKGAEHSGHIYAALNSSKEPHIYGTAGKAQEPVYNNVPEDIISGRAEERKEAPIPDISGGPSNSGSGSADESV